jgi:hypothetical protein
MQLSSNELNYHEEYDNKKKKWFCSGWISRSDWLDIHGYDPKKLPKFDLEKQESDDN